MSLFAKSITSYSFILINFQRYLFLFIIFWAHFLQLTNDCNGQRSFLGNSMENQIHKKVFKGSIRANDFRPSKSIYYEKQFLKKHFLFKDWGKHFSKLGQKKFTPENKISASFDKLFKKNVKMMPNITREISGWDKYLANINKDARIELSEKAQLLRVRETYNLVLQDMGYFHELAESMDLRSINRYQFRSNRPRGEIPVDKPEVDNPSLN